MRCNAVGLGVTKTNRKDEPYPSALAELGAFREAQRLFRARLLVLIEAAADEDASRCSSSPMRAALEINMPPVR